uniref:SAM domain-containing protein n=1 Tax=Haemonchus placei TaxID=6290 RepID=A0A0N4W2Z7_HAEPC
LEERMTSLQSSNPVDQNLLYSTLVKVKADSEKIEGKLRRITRVGIGEQADEVSTKKIRTGTSRKNNAHRHPPVKPRNQGGRDRFIKIEVPSSAMKDKLLRHMKSGRQSLTRRFVHSYARRDYTVEELELDRSLRKQAGLANAKVGKLQYVVRDLQIHQLKNARHLPYRSPTSSSKSAKVSSGSLVGSMDASIVGTSRSPNISP